MNNPDVERTPLPGWKQLCREIEDRFDPRGHRNHDHGRGQIQFDAADLRADPRTERQLMETRLTADVVALAKREDKLHVLLIRRGWEPFAGMLALPGGHIKFGEHPIEAACRELAEETGIHLDPTQLTFTKAYADPDRDPRGQYATWAYLAVLDGEPPQPTAGDDAAESHWLPIDSLTLTGLAFDHWKIIRDALHRYQAETGGRTLAVREALEEYTARRHGIFGSAEPTWFLDWLTDCGFTVVPTRTTGDCSPSIGEAPGAAVAVNAETVTGSIVGCTTDADSPGTGNVRVTMNLGTVSGNVIGYRAER